MGPAHQGLSIEIATSLLTALLETTDHFKTLDFWVRNLDLLVVRCPVRISVVSSALSVCIRIRISTSASARRLRLHVRLDLGRVGCRGCI